MDESDHLRLRGRASTERSGDTSVSGELVIAVGDQIGDGEQSALVRRLGKFGDDAAGLFGECLRAFLGALDALVPVQDVQDLTEGDLVVVSVGENGFDKAALLRLGRFKRVNQRERDLSLPQVVTEGLAEDLLAGGEVEKIVDQM